MLNIISAITAPQVIPLTVDYLVVAGGGGGGGGTNSTGLKAGGGGGAGGYQTTTGTSGGGASALSPLNAALATNYTVTVGSFGAGGATGTAGTSGSNSVFNTTTSTGGGGGGGTSAVNGKTGGSGGGGHCDYGTGGARTASPVQGNNGAAGAGSIYAGAGGGAGSAASGETAGSGLTSDITSLTYAEGGNVYSGSDKTTKGSGGRGGAENIFGQTNNGQNGVAGVVVLRYPSSYTITIGAGLTGSTSTSGANKITTITAGTGNVSWA